MEHSSVVPSAVFAASFIRVACHLLYFIHGEHHLQAPQIAAVHLFVGFIVTLLLYEYVIADISKVAFTGLTICASYVLSPLSSEVLYRIFLHHLKHFPGSPGLAASKLWQVWKIRHLDQYRYLDSLQKQYGDFVRTSKLPCYLAFQGPEELTIFHSDEYKAVHSGAAKITKSPWFDMSRRLVSVVTTRSIPDHNVRRRLIDAGSTMQGRNGIRSDSLNHR